MTINLIGMMWSLHPSSYDNQPNKHDVVSASLIIRQSI